MRTVEKNLKMADRAANANDWRAEAWFLREALDLSEDRLEIHKRMAFCKGFSAIEREYYAREAIFHPDCEKPSIYTRLLILNLCEQGREADAAELVTDVINLARVAGDWELYDGYMKTMRSTCIGKGGCHAREFGPASVGSSVGM